MKNIQNRILSVIAGLVMTSLMSVNAEMKTVSWQSTSTLQATGSVHRAQVIEVDAPASKYKLIPMASTTSMRNTGYIPTPFEGLEDEAEAISQRRKIGTPSDPGSQSEESPVGEPWVLLLFAALAAAVIALRRRFVVHELNETIVRVKRDKN